MKKAPEGTSTVITSLVEQLSVDLSSFAKNGAAATALRMIKSPTESVRAYGQRIIRAFAKKCADPTAFDTLVKTFVEALQGKGPAALAQIYQRYATFVALSDIAQAAAMHNSQMVTELAGEVVQPVLIASMEKETDETNQMLCAVALGKWLAAQTQGSNSNGNGSGNSCSGAGAGIIRPPVLESIRVGLGKSKAIGLSHLVALTVAVKCNSEIAAEFVPLAPALVNFVKEAAKKPQTVQVEGVLAIRLLIDAAALSSAAVGAIESAKLWPSVSNSGTSFLYCKAILQQATLPTVSSTLPVTNATTLAAHITLQSQGQRIVSALITESLVSITAKVAAIFPNQLTTGIAATALATATATSSATSSGSGGGSGSVPTELAISSVVPPVGPTSSLIACLLHPQRDVRQTVTSCVRSVLAPASDGTPSVSPSPSAAGIHPTAQSLLDCLYGILCTWSAQQEQLTAAARADYKSITTVPGEEDLASSGGISGFGTSAAAKRLLGVPGQSRIAEAVLACLQAARPKPTSHLVAVVLLLCGHPMVS
jgi:hypothetical protein